MHDFICSECSATPLASNELQCSPGECRMGETFLLLNASNILLDNITLQCKIEASLYDSVYGYGAHIGMNCECIAKGWVDINSCILRCNRCNSRLGDGELSSEEVEESSNQGLVAKDLASARLYLHSVVIKGENKMMLRIEQVFRYDHDGTPMITDCMIVGDQ